MHGGERPSVAEFSLMQRYGTLSLRRNFAWTLAGNVVFNLCQWGVLVILARLGSAGMVGRFALGSAVAAPVLMLANLQLRTVQATDASLAFSFCEYRRLRLLTSAAAVAVVAVIGLAFYGGPQAVVILLLGVVKAFDSISDIHHGLFQLYERMDLVGRSLAMRGILNLVGFAAVFSGTGKLSAALLGLLASSIVTIGFMDVRGARAVQTQLGRGADDARGNLNEEPAPQPWRVRARSLVLLALPLGFVMMLVSLETNMPRYFIEGRFDETALGIFAVVAYFNAAGATVVGALAQAATPRLAKAYVNGRRAEFRSVLQRLIAVAAIVGVAGIVVAATAGEPLLRLFYGAGFAEHTRLFVLLMVAGAANLLATGLGAPVSAMRLFSVQAWIHLGNVAFLAGLLFLSLGRLGLEGAAIAMTASGVILSVAYATQVRRGLCKVSAGARCQ